MCREINKEIKMPKMRLADGSYINVAPIIEHPDAYAKATKARIIANANKTFCKTFEDYLDIESFISSGRIGRKNDITIYAENFVGSLASAYDNYGKLSEKQVLAIRKCIADRNARNAERNKAIEEQKARSAFLGVVSEKLTAKAVVDSVIVTDANKFSYYDSDTQYTYLMRDEQGNRIVYRTKSRLLYKFAYSKKCLERFQNITREGNSIIIHDDAFVSIKAGMTIEFTGSIKMHTEYKGEKQTVVQRIKVTSLEFKEGAIKQDFDKRED
jgi:hypothetical protein